VTNDERLFEWRLARFHRIRALAWWCFMPPIVIFLTGFALLTLFGSEAVVGKFVAWGMSLVMPGFVVAWFFSFFMLCPSCKKRYNRKGNASHFRAPRCMNCGFEAPVSPAAQQAVQPDVE
jgi:hypothetical protein